MQTNLADFIKHTRAGAEADEILRKCVHCGFCNATCPTYQLLGDELDGPRGRIYQIKQVLEGTPATLGTQLHLDRCLTCRNCETTCPSGVQYSRLLDIGRAVVEQQIGRSPGQRLLRAGLQAVLPRPAIFGPLLRTGQALRGLLPQALKNKLPAKQDAGVWPRVTHARKMLLLDGCVQPAMAPNINFATARVLSHLGIELQRAPKAGCCGALRHHLNEQEAALQDMRNNIDAWWPLVEAGAEAIVMTASGCGVTVKEYGHLLAHDPVYADKAARIALLTRDLSEILPQFEAQLVQALQGKISARVVWHPPCTLQHGQQIRGKVEGLLKAIGVDVRLCADSHLCCGSAGTYSVLQPKLSYQLRDNKLKNLLASQPDVIVSANIGCLTHLQSGTATPVRHWVELIDQVLS
ncbi:MULTISPECIES: glycolate oxidase subunit GlcF [unclassified Undibacterium]|uniref:glycolate oxidase subunit GlcF n=1 Tax=unclassified Undibacterium TaxID=2630295 RepID=UPI002AC9926A|nr:MULTISPECIES: glycolate oxidase subunit GlcF [unclassified Undibacterium]MEB0137944.1 glycolate oxidase subunit GlcF [Undibacterium sp. CCC2.1]MEB0172064.1 glycolate oxidase subunit GlcF [Undibacterium sp. CCC1.1]MEB0174952.1 glycolate oxidase subunit GlcF [Undibacterium sp. CCC3.4]MEB0214840.1 glycolate oxidase subunit GlcF [Undibacterium sp. 5I2]WPX45396.1 glycolate oxidase subunit GlcF [Undibacterium sp. CCC3.4]